MGAMSEPPKDPLIGARIGKKEDTVIGRTIGQGGSGSIYIAWDETRQRHVALKFLHEAFISNQNLLKRFMLEGRRFSKLEHPNLVQVYGWGEKRGRLYIASEYVEGNNLYEILQMRGSVPLDRSLQICRAVAAGLSEAHRNGIVHRDLKPENVMVRNQDNVVKVLDFGIAKDLKDDQLELTGLGMYIGTPAYSAPEQIRGEGVDHRADIFSLGVILYELLTGRVAFDGRHSTEVLRSTLKEEPIPITELNRMVTRSAAHLIETMIRKNPDRRYQSMIELMGEIDDLMCTTEDAAGLDDVTVRHNLKELFE